MPRTSLTNITHAEVASHGLPASLMVNGQPLYGHFDGPPRELGLNNFVYLDVMDKEVSRLGCHCAYKQFEFVAIHTQQYIIGVALADIAYLGSGFCYVFDKTTQRLYERRWLSAPFTYQLGRSPYQSQSGMAGVRIERKEGRWSVALELVLKADKSQFGALNATKPTPQTVADMSALPLTLKAQVELVPLPQSLPMAMCTPTGYSGWTYTQKHNALSVIGELSMNGESQSLAHALAGYDFSAGFMRRQTSWRWASINAEVDGRRLGLNLAAGVNETGSSENVLWLDGVKCLLSAVHVDFDRRASPPGPWHIWSERGELELWFSPIACRKEKTDLWLLKSNFRQFIGHFSGYVRDLDGARLAIDGVWGLTEDHVAKW